MTTKARRDLLTTDDAADYLAMSPATLRSWRKENRGPASFKIGGSVVYRRSALEDWLTAQEAITTRGGVR